MRLNSLKNKVIDFLNGDGEDLAPARGVAHLDKCSTLNICNKLMIRSRRTPDFSELRMLKSIPLFVYGVEMVNGDANQYLKGAKYLGKAHTASPRFIMKTDLQTGKPVVFNVPEAHKLQNKIRGELYQVSVEHIHGLDHYNVNNVFSERRKVNVLAENQDSIPNCKMFSGMPILPAYMYFGKMSYFEDRKMNTRHSVRYTGIDKNSGISFFEWVNQTDLLTEEIDWDSYMESRYGLGNQVLL